jgi:hypothetical protein
VAVSPFGIVAGGGTWPALLVTVLVALVLGLAGRLRLKVPTLPSPKGEGAWPTAGFPQGAGKFLSARLPSMPEWTRFLLWGAFGVAVFNVLTRP